MLKRVGKMPHRMAVMIMVLMLALGVTAGNRNALARARTPVANAVVEMRNRVAVMVGKSSNYVTIGNRLGVVGNALVEERNAAQSLVNSNRTDAAYLKELASAGERLNQAASELNKSIQTAIDKLPNSDSNKAVETKAREAAYDDWMQNRASYLDIASYNSAAESLQAVYRAVPTRWLWSGYNYPQLSGQ